MTIASADTVTSITGNGVTTAIPVPFVFFGEDELEVIERVIASGVETTKALSTDYTVAGGGGDVGTVTANVAPPATVQWFVRRNTKRTQQTDLTENDNLPAEALERALDRLAAVMQEFGELVDRAVVFPVTDPESSRSTLGSSVERAGKYLAAGVDGKLVWTAGTTSNPIISTFAEQLLDDVSAVAMRGTLGLGSAAAHDAGSQAEVDAGTAARVVEADRLLASPGYGRGFRNAAGRNGGLEVWQRGAGGAASIAVAASTTAYTADGWALKTNANQASVVDQVAGIATGSRWAARVRRTAGQTGTGAMSFELPLDVDEIVALRGNLVTLSLTLQAGANWSPASGNLTIELRTGTGTPAKRSAGAYTGEAADISQAPAITTSPTRYSFTSAAAIGATVTQASIYLTWTPAGTAGAADDFTIDDVQLEIGLARTTFERLPFALELLLCQRHFWKTFKYDVAPAQNAGSPTADHQWGAQRAGAASNFGFLPFPVVMRSAPTITFFNPSAANAQARDLDAAADCSSTSGSGTVRGMRFTTVGNASTAIGNTLAFHATADAGI